jgi:hypothetical protein
MKVNINLSKQAIDKLLEKYGYKRSYIKIGYSVYAYQEEELYKHLECVSYYQAEVAYPAKNKPKELTLGLITPSMAEPYLINNVVDILFNKLLVEKLL